MKVGDRVVVPVWPGGGYELGTVTRPPTAYPNVPEGITWVFLTLWRKTIWRFTDDTVPIPKGASVEQIEALVAMLGKCSGSRTRNKSMEGFDF